MVAFFRGCGPWRALTDIPQEDYSRLLFQSLMGIARAREWDCLDLEVRESPDSEDESLAETDADYEDEGKGGGSVDDCGRVDGKAVLPVTFVFGYSLTSPSDLRKYAERGWFDFDDVRCPGGETLRLFLCHVRMKPLFFVIFMSVASDFLL